MPPCYFLCQLPFHSLTLTWSPSFGVMWSRPPWPQVARKLTSLSPIPPHSLPHSKFPTPRGFPKRIVRLTKTTSQSWLPWSETPVLFTTVSCDSLHHFGGESPFVSNICIKFRLSFNTESQYSTNWLLQRVTTPRLIYSGEFYSRESLLTAESYFQKLWRTPPSFKGTMKQKMDDPCRVLITKKISRVKNMGYLRLCCWLLTVIDSGESNFVII